jgi:type I restriction enzyme S subunit
MTKSTNSIPKGYKLTKIGTLPVDWEVVTINSTLNTGKNVTYGIVQPGEYQEDGVPMIRSQDYSRGWVDLSNIMKVSPEIDKPYERSRVKAGDILLTVVGANVGVIERLPEQLDGANISRSVARISVNEKKGSSEFIFQFLKSIGIRKFVHLNTVGGAQPVINLKNLSVFPIPSPPLPQQQKIAQILATWDKAIQTQTQLINAKKELKRGLMQRLLTGKGKEYRFRDLLRVVKRNFDWDDNELYDLISVRRRSGGLFHRSSLHGHQIKTKTLRTAQEGDFLISKMQILHGASGLTTSEFDGMKISGSYLAVVSAKPKVLDIKYLNLLSQTKQFYHKTYISSYGVHIEKMTFDFKTFLKKKVVIPSLEHQQKTVEILTTADKEITLLETRLTELREQKRGLMQRLLTGAVRVTVPATA